MDYNYIESLVLSTKEGDAISKEKLLAEFKPFILTLSKKTFIKGYDFYDIKNECYLSLLKAIKMYDPKKHRFVAYATMAIKRNMYFLIKKTKTNTQTAISESLTFTGDLDSLNLESDDKLDSNLSYAFTKRLIIDTIDNLDNNEQELLTYVFLRNNTIRSYAQYKNMKYSTAAHRKSQLSKKLNRHINILN